MDCKIEECKYYIKWSNVAPGEPLPTCIIEKEKENCPEDGYSTYKQVNM